MNTATTGFDSAAPTSAHALVQAVSAMGLHDARVGVDGVRPVTPMQGAVVAAPSTPKLARSDDTSPRASRRVPVTQTVTRTRRNQCCGSIRAVPGTVWQTGAACSLLLCGYIPAQVSEQWHARVLHGHVAVCRFVLDHTPAVVASSLPAPTRALVLTRGALVCTCVTRSPLPRRCTVTPPP